MSSFLFWGPWQYYSWKIWVWLATRRWMLRICLALPIVAQTLQHAWYWNQNFELFFPKFVKYFFKWIKPCQFSRRRWFPMGTRSWRAAISQPLSWPRLGNNIWGIWKWKKETFMGRDRLSKIYWSKKEPKTERERRLGVEDHHNVLPERLCQLCLVHYEVNTSVKNRTTRNEIVLATCFFSSVLFVS